MTRLSDLFRTIGRPVLIGFTVAGDPDYESGIGIAKTIIGAGADILELGVPFTDPVADGPVIQKAHGRALSGGATTDRLFSTVREIRKSSDVPIVLLVYYNIIYRRGVGEFCREAAAAGIDGILAVDLPPEESEEMERHLGQHCIDRISIVTPGTSDERMKMIAGHTSGFLYLTTLLGVTGARERLAKESRELVRRAGKHSDLPLCVGFGISRPEHVREIVSTGAQGVIVGSAIVSRIEGHLDNVAAMNEDIREYVKTLRDAIGN
ncbi:MAG: tryptophan synthase subunit alpha [Methanoregulaceae archaeon]|nr:tryptophan synthase subunit alpha [Methanoregulaceae archaeon]